MATVTTQIPSTPHHIRTAVLAAVAVLIAMGVMTTVWALAAEDSGTGSGLATPAVKSSDQVRAEFDASLRDEQAAKTFSTSVKSPDQVRAEFEDYLREQSSVQSRSIKSADDVRAEFETELRLQRAASREPVAVKSADEVQVEFETWLRDQLRPAGS